MENSKKFAEEALNGPASLRQHPHCQEGTTRDAPIASGNRTDSVWPLGSSLLTLVASSLVIKGGGLTTTICLPRLIGMARVSLNVSPSQNQLWPWFDVDHLLRLILWRVGWLRLRPELRVILLLYLLLPSSFIFKTLIIFPLNLLDLSAQLESLRLATEHVAGFVNARGAVPVVCLHDILNHVREVALHFICHGAVMALAST